MRRGTRAALGTAVAVVVAGALTAGVVTVTAQTPGGPAAAGAGAGAAKDYLVFHTPNGRDAATRAIEAQGAAVVSADARLGYVIARSSGGQAAFAERLGREPAVVGVSGDRAIGYATAARAGAVRAGAAPAVPREAAPAKAARAGDEPLAGRQWDMKMIGATPKGSYAAAPGSGKVLVGVIDTGIDGKHPDIAPNFNRELSRNFVTDRPKDPNGEVLDGPCEYKGCKDPADVDDDGHGTHVASTIASPRNGIGVAGVAPGAQLVNLRAGQDSGLFFLKPSLDALAYAADNGIDVVNMSYYVDPWLFNCTANPADSKAEQLEQRAIVTGMQRALDYARSKGVTLIAALGNGATDLGKPKTDLTSPDYPLNTERARKIDNSCLNVPVESKGVISVAAVGATKEKAQYSDYGTEQTDLAAPGGDADVKGRLRGERGMILAAAPEHVLRARKLIDAKGKPKDGSVVRDCTGGTCSYYQYLQGTSMAAPHATGVAAILIDRFGEASGDGVTLDPAKTERLLNASSTPRPCPSPRRHVYSSAGEKVAQVCEGGKSKNGFYGRGIVNAQRAAVIDP
ncbi:Subtilase family protein [Sinosporangium album]|uniref:Subtilase family protein n=1 Tax=Sinosporangium album TaxID=504805 RepID=A0A1G7X7J2_9ACTN|nr:S8 family serine peptidase [Sinosporangium album]SDG80142.1 Subtilase family protein [Sinosporangium album]